MKTKWSELDFFKSEKFEEIKLKLQTEIRAGKSILPGSKDIFRSLKLTPLNKTKVMILGQDPYPTKGVPNGLAFSVNGGKLNHPASLRNIFKELVEDIGCDWPISGDLSPWAKQGVLLINSSLTVEEGNPGSHAKWGWDLLIKEIIKETSKNDCIYVLWGAHAQKNLDVIPPWCNVITSVHPSPLSCHRGFFGSKPFSKINGFLEEKIDWSLDN